MASLVSDYCTVFDVKREAVRTVRADDDDIIDSIIHQVSREIDRFVGANRHFYNKYQTRYFDALRHVLGPTLWLDDDLTWVDTITLGDQTTLPDAAYSLIPFNTETHRVIKIKASAGRWWAFRTDPERAISISGSWGFVMEGSVPLDVRRACIMLARWRYDQSRAPYETTGMGDTGATTIPSAIPRNIQDLLLPYRIPDVMRIEGLGYGRR